MTVLLSACGDAYQSVQMGPWKPASSGAAPKASLASPPSRFQLTILEMGQGPEIGPGRLVHASVTGEVLPPPEESPGRYLRKIDDVWFWIGDADLYVNADPILQLGTADLRAAFVGVREGSRLSLLLDPARIGSELELPTRGFLLHFTKKYRETAGFDGDYVRFTKVARYELKILDVCSGTLLQKRAVLKQWGYIPHLWYDSPDYPFARKGILEWVAIEAKCPASNQEVRLEKGPAYRRPSLGTLDISWPESYEKAMSRGRVSTME